MKNSKNNNILLICGGASENSIELSPAKVSKSFQVWPMMKTARLAAWGTWLYDNDQCLEGEKGEQKQAIESCELA